MRTVYTMFLKYVRENDIGKASTLWKSISDEVKQELKALLLREPNITEVDMFKDIFPAAPVENELQEDTPLILSKHHYPKRGRKIV